MKHNASKIACVIILYNPDINNLQKRIKAISQQVSEIVLVDNSTNINKAIKTNLPNSCHYIVNKKNLGIAAAQNIGIKWALSEKCTHVLIMDQDSLLPENATSKLLEAEADLLNKNITLAAVAPIYKDIRKSQTTENQSGDDQYIVVNNLISSGTLVRAEVIEDVGLMNEWLFIDGVDDEWCFRALEKGYHMFQVKDISMQHELGEVRKLFGGRICFNYHKPFRYYYMFRNYIYMLKKKNVPYAAKYLYIKVLIKLLLKVVFLSHKWSYCKNIYKGVIDGCKARIK